MYSLRTFSLVFFASSALWIPVSCQRSVEFFYSPQNDTCAYGGQSFVASQNSDHGGMCAWSPTDSRVYACPAPDPTCWSFDQTCGGGTEAAGSGQILCASGSYLWCCLDTETCTTLAGQINVCVSDFTSPNSGISLAAANNAELQSLGVSSVATSIETASPSIFSTRSVDSTGALITNSATTSSSTSPSTTSASGSKTGSSSASATSSHASEPANSTPADSSSSGISTGAIVGIVVAVIAALAIGAFAIWAVMKRRRRRSELLTNKAHDHAVEKDASYLHTSQAANSPYASSKFQYQQKQPVYEADASNMVRAELPSDLPHSELP